MPIGDSIPLIGIRWDDVLFVALAASCSASALAVVTCCATSSAAGWP